MNQKKIAATISAMVFSLALLAGCGGTNTNTGAQAPAVGASSAPAAGSATAPIAAPGGNVSAGMAGTADSSQYIGEAQARSAALENAGLAEADVQFVWTKLEYDNGRAEYDIEFVRDAGNGTMEEYDYEIDALTGEILSLDREAENYDPAAVQNGTNAQSGQYIGEEAAKQAALTHAGKTADTVSFARCNLDFDDGRWKYEVEFYEGNAEYDYDIDATTGEVISYDYDAEYYTPGSAAPGTAAQDPANGAQTTPGAAITAEQAKQIALDHAGVDERSTRRMEMDVDYDHGRTVYEFSWKVDWTEYEYEIDAATGDILSFSQEED